MPNKTENIAINEYLAGNAILGYVELEDLVGSIRQGTEWRLGCVIIPRYMPPHPLKDTRPIVVVRYAQSEWFLRHSAGPLQGFFWDMYGDDMLNVGLALRAIIYAPPPPQGKPYIEFTLPLKKKTE